MRQFILEEKGHTEGSISSDTVDLNTIFDLKLGVDSSICIRDQRVVEIQKSIVYPNFGYIKCVRTGKSADAIDRAAKLRIRPPSYVGAVAQLCGGKRVIQEEADLTDEFWNENNLNDLSAWS